MIQLLLLNFQDLDEKGDKLKGLMWTFSNMNVPNQMARKHLDQGKDLIEPFYRLINDSVAWKKVWLVPMCNHT